MTIVASSAKAPELRTANPRDVIVSPMAVPAPEMAEAEPPDENVP
jgi:hypothetical protein